MTSTTQDYYELLGVDEKASEDDVRKAYRELARKYHPDKTGGDKEAEERLKEISAAYDVLKNAEKRKEYDQQRAFGPDGFDFRGASATGADFSDIFSSIFGATGGPSTRAYSQARRGNDLEAAVSISLNDVVSGVTKTLRINRPDTCEPCAGTGAAPGTSPVTCADCGGIGELSSGNGLFAMSQTCPRCHGAGETIATPCDACAGNGRVIAQREIKVTVPRGADRSTRLRVPGEGEAGIKGGPAGDLFVRVKVKKDPFFTRDGNNLTCEVPITFADAALGAKISVPTLDGVAKLSVAPGTQNGAQLRMREMGLPSIATGQRGDELVKIIVEVPKKLSREQSKLLREFDGDYEPDSHPLREKFAALLAKFRGPSN